MKRLAAAIMITACSGPIGQAGPEDRESRSDSRPVSGNEFEKTSAEAARHPIAHAPAAWFEDGPEDGGRAEADVPSAAAARELELAGALTQGGFARGRFAGMAPVRVMLDGKDVPFDPERGFFIAFGRDAGSAAQMRLDYADGTSVSRSLAISQRKFPESRLPPITQQIEADPDFEARRRAEIERIGAARAAPSGLEGWGETFVMPAVGEVSGVFGSRRFYGNEARSPHSGLDIAAPLGAAVAAPAGGRVVLASPPAYSYEGNLVIVDHGLGLYSAFLHLSEVDVSVGDVLTRGERIGSVGASGRATGPHLHWGVWWNGVRFDPETLVNAPGGARPWGNAPG